jgi:hypothetical protein
MPITTSSVLPHDYPSSTLTHILSPYKGGGCCDVVSEIDAPTVAYSSLIEAKFKARGCLYRGAGKISSPAQSRRENLPGGHGARAEALSGISRGAGTRGSMAR